MPTETRYTLTGLKCGGCVAKATAALQAVPGVTAAQVDLATQTARVEGEVAPVAVIAALNAAGYPAVLKTG